MNSLINTFQKTGNLHHAYFLVGESDVVEMLKNFLEQEVEIKISGNPDFRHFKLPTFSIDHARDLVASQTVKDFEGTRKIFIIETDVITEEAQNALLKVFEEPTVGTHFFIISPQDILLPTLRSRMHVVEVSRVPLAMSPKMAKGTFDTRMLDMTLVERLAKVKEITDGITDEDKTKQDAISFLNNIEKELYNKKNGGVEKNAKSLEITEHARASLYDRGAPVKMILEHVVLTV